MSDSRMSEARRQSPRDDRKEVPRRPPAMHDTGVETNAHKADFSKAYTEADPRQYFRTLMAYDYQVPARATPILASVLAASRRGGRTRTVLDLCCSYGINSALLYSPDGPTAVARRYQDPAIAGLTAAELADADARYYAARSTDARILGLDISVPAIRYGIRAGLLADAWSEDLESHEPSRALIRGIQDVGLLYSTGGVGYIGHRSFARLLRHIPDPENLWLAIFVLRVFDYSEIESLLDSYGLVTERLPISFRQRRFVDEEEQAAAIQDVIKRGLSPQGKESAGWFHADCYISRPAVEAERMPLPSFLTS